MTAHPNLPKAELHCHLEGSASAGFVREIAAARGVDIGGLIGGDRYRWEGFSGFLEAYDRVAALFTHEDDYRRLARDHLEAIARDGAIYAEIFVSSDHALAAGLSPDGYLAAAAQGAQDARESCGIEARFVLVGIRHLGPAAVERAAREAVRLSSSLPVTGFGLAGDERRYRPADFAAAFAIAREGGLGLTAHAGEFAGADGVRETIDALRVSRIGHGVRAIEDAALVRRIASEGIVLEICPGSNLALGVVPSAEAHPLRALHAAGVRVTVGSDDPPFFATDLAAEYRFADRQGFTAPERLALTRNAIEAAFCDEATRTRLLGRLATDAIRLGAPGSNG